MTCWLAVALPAQFIPESTHDHTTTVGSPIDLAEAGTDVKTPGDGRTYSVATIEVEQTFLNPSYSSTTTPAQVNVQNPIGFSVEGFAGVRKQVVLLQCVDAAGGIVWQRYFFGATPGLTNPARRPTNARGISVWTAGAGSLDTRIAICGESYDDLLPRSQDPAGFPQPILAVSPDPTGFIAVYNGAGDLLWSHHFFGAPLGGPGGNQPDCTITDVSIRVEGEGSAARDVVTYCGLSSYGNPVGGNVWLTPVLPYQTAATPDNLSDGDTDFGPGQWDGIVGRISRNHLNSYDPQNPADSNNLRQEFHSIVGGPDQDGLFGIAEAENDRFFAVGSARHLGIAAPAVGFPFSPAPIQFPSFRVGTLLAFDATATRAGTPAPLELERAVPLGSVGEVSSHASDVLVQLEFTKDPRQNLVYVVGTTNDPVLPSSVGATAAPSPSDVLRGDSDGFLLVGVDNAPSPMTGGQRQLTMVTGAFVGGDGVDGLTGVNSWNEHTDYVQVCGYSSFASGYQMQVASFIDVNLITLRRFEFGSALHSSRPAVLGERNATDGAGAPPYLSELPGGLVAGGGISTDERGRLTLVGSTWGDSGYPVEGGGRDHLGAQDAVRTELDLLPIGVGRTDGTGSVLGGLPSPWPPAGFDGGTTPTCLVNATPFGIRVGETRPTPALRRMLIEFEGENEFDALPVIWATRPSEFGEVVAAALQIGLPTPVPVMLDGAELWTLNNPLVLSETWLGFGERSWRVPFTVALPPAPAQFSAQVACLLVLGPQTSGSCTGQLTTFAGPALFFEY